MTVWVVPVLVLDVPELVVPELVAELEVVVPEVPDAWGAAGAATTVSLAVAGPEVEVW